ncbi:MAG: alcohol dehydrogenase catalytic domain-containing protein [Alphaproteobacteria bacterium]|nr:alcohol dehydrogenase catalytic domain-containing protein [Alphaproteobacteria bacterium]
MRKTIRKETVEAVLMSLPRIRFADRSGGPDMYQGPKMYAAVLQAPRKFEIVERSRPVAGTGEVVVRIAATAVCHTDLEIYTGRHPGVRYPVVMGHEATGTVDAVGAGVTGLQPGQNVLINPVIACGHCDSCARGAGHLCRNAGILGREIEGSLSQYVRLAAHYVHALPQHLSLDTATLIETLATVRHAQQRVDLTGGESVVVLGQGTSGLLHTRLAVLAGATPVIAVSRTKWKLDMARHMDAHHAVLASAEAAIDEVLRLTDGAGVDVVIDTTGSAGTLQAGIDMLRPGGRFCSFSVSHELVSGFSTFPLYYKEVSIIGSRALTPSDIDASIELVASGKIDVSGFVTTTYPLDRAAAAFEEYERNPGRILRIVIDSAVA